MTHTDGTIGQDVTFR